jgi:hypothetical protein
MRLPLQWVLVVLGVSLGASASFGAAPVKGPSGGASPRAVVERFDSLMEAGSPEAIAAAQTLTTGPARRLFPLIAETQARLAPFLDTARSRDTVLQDTARGDWAVLAVRSTAVFTKPFLGLERLEATQAVHLYRDPRGKASGWKIADFEEVAEGARVAPRTGSLTADSAGAGPVEDAPLFPISPRAPSQADMRRVTRMRLRVAMRGGDSLPLPAPAASERVAGWRVVARGASWAEIETRRPSLASTAPRPKSGAALSVALRPYLASTTDLDLTDPLLKRKAAELKKGARDDAEIARRVRLFVSENFDYKLGATLFATSREALRDRKGDCSEAAVLVAALLRAAGIPSRVALGYATLERGVWIGHAWAEAYLADSAGGSWVGVDAALREFPAGPARVTLATLSGQKPMKAEASNLVIHTLANLDVTILEARAGDEVLPLVEHPGAAAESRAFWDKLLEGMGR